jgi:hypothetical protein
MSDASSDGSDVQNGLADKENVRPSVEVSQVEKKAVKAPVECSLPRHSYPFGHDKRRVSVEVSNCE